MFLNLLQNGAAAARGGFDTTMIIMIVVMFAIVYFFMIRPQNKRRKEMQKFRDNLTVGQKIVTAGGIYGTVKDLNEGASYIGIEIANGVKIQIDRNYVFADASQNQQM